MKWHHTSQHNTTHLARSAPPREPENQSLGQLFGGCEVELLRKAGRQQTGTEVVLPLEQRKDLVVASRQSS